MSLGADLILGLEHRIQSGSARNADSGAGDCRNDYLLLWVTQGKVGLNLFILSAAEGAFAIVRAIRHSRGLLTLLNLTLLKQTIRGRNIWNATPVLWLRERLFGRQLLAWQPHGRR